MAVYYFRNTGDVNWGTATNWSLTDGGIGDGAVPTATDDAFFTANSGNCTTNTTSRTCLTLICSGYTNTLTLTNPLLVLGTITLSGSMTIAGASNLVAGATATFTSNGCNIPNLRIGNTTAITLTCADTLNITNLQVAGNNSSTFTINNNSLNVSGNFILGTSTNTNTSAGSTIINLTGTGTWSQNVAGSSFLNTININTSGTISCGTTISYGTGTLTYINGNVIANSTTLVIIATCTLNINNISWGNLTTTNSITITLLSNVIILGNFIFGSTTTSAVVINGNSVLVGGNFTTSTTTANITGTSVIVLNGTGTVNLTSQTTGGFANSLQINTSGIITFATGGLRKSGGIMTYTSGIVNARALTLRIVATTTLINIHKVFIPTVIITNGITVTMNQFFSGIPNRSTSVTSLTTGSSYTVSFQDTFEKVFKFVNLSDCVFSRPLQAILLTNNRSFRNVGLRINNQSPNSVSKNLPSVLDNMTYPTFSLTSDPTIN